MNLNNPNMIIYVDKRNEKKNALEKIYNLPYRFFKPYYDSVIPLKIYQTWATKNLPPKMNERVELLKIQNPKFEYFLFDDADCREFIKNNFEPLILEAYDGLIPGAYKADLWRCCVLYINGGIYLDIKFLCVNGFKLIELTEKEHYVKDRLSPLSIYNAVMVCKPRNELLLRIIHRIAYNVKTKYYGSNSLDPTGPKLIGNIILKNKFKVNVDMTHYKHGGYVIYKNRFVLSTNYDDYDSERAELHRKKHTKGYNALWNEGKIYK